LQLVATLDLSGESHPGVVTVLREKATLRRFTRLGSPPPKWEYLPEISWFLLKPSKIGLAGENTKKRI
jgi:hypothetical protein